MRKLLFIVLIAAGACAFAADQYDIRPDAKAAAAPTAVEWQNKNDAQIAAATADEVLAAFVADAAAADALLAKIGPAYAGDPIVLTQIAAVTQWTMLSDPWYCLFWDGPHTAGRKVWTAALGRVIAQTKDDYVRTFCRQQLDLCIDPDSVVIRK